MSSSCRVAARTPSTSASQGSGLIDGDLGRIARRRGGLHVGIADAGVLVPRQAVEEQRLPEQEVIAAGQPLRVGDEAVGPDIGC